MEAGDGLKHLDARPAIFLRRRKLSYSTIEKLWGYFFIIPFLLLFLLFHIIPAGLAVWLSVVHWKPLGGSQWIGLLNYSRIFANDAFWFRDEKHVSLCFHGGSNWYGPIFLEPRF